MNSWPFVLAAYAITGAASAALAWTSWRAMRRAETMADRLRADRSCADRVEDAS